jgi:hypothetical protein
LGEVFALCLYREREGYEFCRHVLELAAEEELDPEVFGFQQNVLMAEFVKKAELEQADRDVLALVNWPVPKKGGPKYVTFRSYRPHMYPWFIDAEEARLIILGLERMTVYFQWRADGNLCVEATVQGLPTYKWTTEPGGASGEWKLAIRPLPEPPPLAQGGDFAALEPACRRIRGANFPATGIWQVRVRPMPMAIADAERPFFASVGLAVGADTGYVFGSEVMRPEGSASQRCAQFLLKTIENVQTKPRAVEVENGDAEGVFKTVCDYLKIPIKRRVQLPALEAASRALFEYLQGRDSPR